MEKEEKEEDENKSKREGKEEDVAANSEGDVVVVVRKKFFEDLPLDTTVSADSWESNEVSKDVLKRKYETYVEFILEELAPNLSPSDAPLDIWKRVFEIAEDRVRDTWRQIRRGESVSPIHFSALLKSMEETKGSRFSLPVFVLILSENEKEIEMGLTALQSILLPLRAISIPLLSYLMDEVLDRVHSLPNLKKFTNVIWDLVSMMERGEYVGNVARFGLKLFSKSNGDKYWVAVRILLLLIRNKYLGKKSFGKSTMDVLMKYSSDHSRLERASGAAAVLCALGYVEPLRAMFDEEKSDPHRVGVIAVYKVLKENIPVLDTFDSELKSSFETALLDGLEVVTEEMVLTLHFRAAVYAASSLSTTALEQVKKILKGKMSSESFPKLQFKLQKSMWKTFLRAAEGLGKRMVKAQFKSAESLPEHYFDFFLRLMMKNGTYARDVSEWLAGREQALEEKFSTNLPIIAKLLRLKLKFVSSHMENNTGGLVQTLLFAVSHRHAVLQRIGVDLAATLHENQKYAVLMEEEGFFRVLASSVSTLTLDPKLFSTVLHLVSKWTASERTARIIVNSGFVESTVNVFCSLKSAESPMFVSFLHFIGAVYPARPAALTSLLIQTGGMAKIQAAAQTGLRVVKTGDVTQADSFLLTVDLLAQVLTYTSSAAGVDQIANFARELLEWVSSEVSIVTPTEYKVSVNDFRFLVEGTAKARDRKLRGNLQKYFVWKLAHYVAANSTADNFAEDFSLQPNFLEAFVYMSRFAVDERYVAGHVAVVLGYLISVRKTLQRLRETGALLLLRELYFWKPRDWGETLAVVLSERHVNEYAVDLVERCVISGLFLLKHTPWVSDALAESASVLVAEIESFRKKLRMLKKVGSPMEKLRDLYTNLQHTTSSTIVLLEWRPEFASSPLCGVLYGSLVHTITKAAETLLEETRNVERRQLLSTSLQNLLSIHKEVISQNATLRAESAMERVFETFCALFGKLHTKFPESQKIREFLWSNMQVIATEPSIQSNLPPPEDIMFVHSQAVNGDNVFALKVINELVKYMDVQLILLEAGNTAREYAEVVLAGIQTIEEEGVRQSMSYACNVIQSLCNAADGNPLVPSGIVLITFTSKEVSRMISVLNMLASLAQAQPPTRAASNEYYAVLKRLHMSLLRVLRYMYEHIELKFDRFVDSVFEHAKSMLELSAGSGEVVRECILLLETVTVGEKQHSRLIMSGVLDLVCKLLRSENENERNFVLLFLSRLLLRSESLKTYIVGSVAYEEIVRLFKRTNDTGERDVVLNVLWSLICDAPAAVTEKVRTISVIFGLTKIARNSANEARVQAVKCLEGLGMSEISAVVSLLHQMSSNIREKIAPEVEEVWRWLEEEIETLSNEDFVNENSTGILGACLKVLQSFCTLQNPSTSVNTVVIMALRTLTILNVSFSEISHQLQRTSIVDLVHSIVHRLSTQLLDESDEEKETLLGSIVYFVRVTSKTQAVSFADHEFMEDLLVLMGCGVVHVIEQCMQLLAMLTELDVGFKEMWDDKKLRVISFAAKFGSTEGIRSSARRVFDILSVPTPPINPLLWGDRDIILWLRIMGLGSYSSALLERGITGRDILSWGYAEIYSLGIKIKEDAHTLKNGVKRLQNAEEPHTQRIVVQGAEYMLERELSVDSSHFVAAAYSTTDSKRFVIKKYENRTQLVHERNVLKSLEDRESVPRVVAETAVESPEHVLVMECGGVTLREYIRLNPSLSERRRVLFSIVLALAHVHSVRWVHTNVLPENIVLFADHWRFVDFAETVGVGEDIPVSYTPSFLSPEMVHAEDAKKGTIEARQSLDMWHIGLVIFDMFAGRSYFGPFERLGRIKTQLREMGRVLYVPATTIEDAAVRELLLHLLTRSPEERWASEAVLSFMQLHNFHHGEMFSSPNLSPTDIALTLTAPLNVAAPESTKDAIKELEQELFRIGKKYRMFSSSPFPRFSWITSEGRSYTTKRGSGSSHWTKQFFRLFLMCEFGNKHALASHRGYQIRHPAEFLPQVGRFAVRLMERMKRAEVVVGRADPLSGKMNAMKVLAEGDEVFLQTQQLLYEASNGFVTENDEIEYFRALKDFLSVADPRMEFGGLERVYLTNGSVAWMCHKHAEEAREVMEHLSEITEAEEFEEQEEGRDVARPISENQKASETCCTIL